MMSTAVLSPCATYRYRLVRAWSPGDLLGWIMLNPSTADASIDDPTIRRCIAFSKAYGFGGLQVTNLFALRATNPKMLKVHPDPVGPQNDSWMTAQPSTVVAAWGANPMAIQRASAITDLFSDKKLMCLGSTANGSPRHPLYVRADTELTPWKGYR